jgi:cation diffusion facilitator family transporter
MSNSAPSLTRYAWLSIAAALITIVMKGAAYFLTGSVGLLSDALESIVNLVGAIMALAMLTWAEQPPDDEHEYGHGKAEYFSSGAEGTLILLAALSIGWASVSRLITPHPIEAIGIGLTVSGAASLVNFVTAVVLLRAGKKYHSITLEADAKHLLTDVWTSAGVIAGVGLVAITGIQRLDPIVALLVAANIIWQGVSLVKRSVLGLMDTALPPEENILVRNVLERFAESGVQFHALRSRQAGARRFVSFHVLVPGRWTVASGHELLEKIEAEIRAVVPNVTVFTHLEPIEDPSSFSDQKLDRMSEP